MALLQQDQGIVPQVIESTGLRPADLKAALADRMQQASHGGGRCAGGAFTNLTSTFKETEKEAKDWGDSYLSTEHFMLAALRGPAPVREDFGKIGFRL